MIIGKRKKELKMKLKPKSKLHEFIIFKRTCVICKSRFFLQRLWHFKARYEKIWVAPSGLWDVAATKYNVWLCDTCLQERAGGSNQELPELAERYNSWARKWAREDVQQVVAEMEGR